MMRDFLILKLSGPMQAWGEHTFEGFRPSANFPTRSGLLGLIGACLGIKRNDPERLQQLADSIGFAVRVDVMPGIKTVKSTDYHTVKDARKDYHSLKSLETIQTWREYLFDAQFSVALWNYEGAVITLDAIELHVKKPVFTPFMGRRSCPLARPLFEKRLPAATPVDALREIEPCKGTIYCDEGSDNVRRFRVRDVPLIKQPRQFASRNVYVYGGDHVSE